MQSSYIGLKAKLSRSYLSQYLLIVVLSIMSLWTMRQTIDSKMEETQFRLSSSCRGLEIAATSLASTPHYVAAQTNAAIASSITSAVDHMDSILAGSLGAVSLYSQEITTFVRAQMASISSSLNSGLDGINSQIRTINGGIQGVSNLFTGGNGDTQSVSLPEVTAKLNFDLPNNFQLTLQNLTNTIPDLEDAQNALAGLISTPFNLLSDSLNSSIKKVSFSELNLPVPAKAADASFCGDLPSGWIPKLGEGLRTGFTVAIWVLIALGILIILANGYLIYLDHKRFEKLVEKVSVVLPSDCQENIKSAHEEAEPIDVLKAVQNPLGWVIYSNIAGKLKNISSRMRLRWFLDYTLYHPSFLFLGIGILGLILINIQILILDRAKMAAISSVSNELQATSGMISSAVQKIVSETVDPYVTQANQRIAEIETQTNQIMFGWINQTVQIINQTSSSFTTGFNDVISKAFVNVPPLKDAISKFVYCMVGSSFESILGIADTLSGSMRLDFPRVNSSIGGIDSEALGDVPRLAQKMAPKLTANSSSDGQSSSGDDYIFQREIDRLTNYYKSILETQKVAFYICIGFGVSGWILGLIALPFLKF